MIKWVLLIIHNFYRPLNWVELIQSVQTDWLVEWVKKLGIVLSTNILFFILNILNIHKHTLHHNVLHEIIFVIMTGISKMVTVIVFWRHSSWWYGCHHCRLRLNRISSSRTTTMSSSGLLFLITQILVCDLFYSKLIKSPTLNFN